jgi:protein SCO1
MRRWGALTLLALLCASASLAKAGVDPVAAQAPRMEFVPPAPGTYELQRIQRSPDAVLLDPAARKQRLASYTTGKITLLTFFYTYCTDPWGCPFAYQVLHDLRDQVLQDTHLTARVRFVSVSFDPSNDTPEAIGHYAAQWMDDKRFEWRFLTAASVGELLPVLHAFGQDVQVVVDEQGRPTRTMNHMLKMFLIDRRGMVREIYSLAYLQPAVLLNDIKTLALEEHSTAVAQQAQQEMRH